MKKLKIKRFEEVFYSGQANALAHPKKWQQEWFMKVEFLGKIYKFL
jgi:hypothetical protein